MKKIIKILSKIFIIYFIVITIALVIGTKIISSRIANPKVITDIQYVQQTDEPSLSPTLSPTPSSTPQVTATVTQKPNPLATTPPLNPTEIPSPTLIPTPVPTPKVVTLKDQVASHNKSSDCWMIINGHVYDITTYFGIHPGGNSTMEKYCGKDGSPGFTTKDKNNPNDHSQNAYSLLEQFRID